MGLLFDVNRCVGCEQCYEACKDLHDQSYDDVPRLNATTYTVLEEREDHYMRKLCMHCDDPSCASVCPVGALQKTSLGPVIYHVDRCMGCRYCMVGCPFDVPKYEWDTSTPRVHKCDMCHDRIVRGEQTACAEACPEEATLFGDRNQLLQTARQRIAAEPEIYSTHIYGEREVGGTSTLFLLPKQWDHLGLRDLPADQAMPQLTWQVLSKIPSMSVVLGTALFGVWWITKRRDEVARVENGAQDSPMQSNEVHDE